MSEQPGKTILVIHQDTDMREGIGDFLVIRGYRVLRAATPETGVELAQAHTPDGIVFEMHNAMRCEWVYAQLRGDPCTRAIPVIGLVYSRSYPEDDWRHAFLDTMLECIFDAEDLLAAVRRITETDTQQPGQSED